MTTMAEMRPRGAFTRDAASPWELRAVAPRHEGGSMASLTVPTWNQLRDWLREMDGLRAVLTGAAA